MHTRRHWTITTLLALTTTAAFPQSFPVAGKPVRILLGVPAGGGADAQLRIVANKLPALLGAPVLVENRPGASMMIAALEVAKADPDGHTLLYTPSSAIVQNPHTLNNVRYDPFKDFTPISMGALGPLVLVVHQSVPVKNVKELVAYAKAHPGTLNYASFGTGTSSHMFGEMLRKQMGIDIVHVPYKGAGDVQKDLVGGRVQMMFAAATGAVAYAQTGRVHMLGVAASRRTDLLPGVPTMDEQGVKGLDIEGWLGYFGPAGMKPEVVATLNGALRKVLADPEVQASYRKGAYEAVSSTPQQFADIVKTSYAQWGEVARLADVTKE